MMRVYPDLGEQVFEARLSNGLLTRVVTKSGFAKAYAFLAVDYGSIDTKFLVDEKNFDMPLGVAHYLEHKMFDLPEGNAMDLFSRWGGSPNAFTSYDMTAYYVECTDYFAENLQTLLRMVAEPYFTAESVEKERGIIAQEILMYEDSPDSRVNEALFSAIFSSHPIRYSIAGTVESIQSITEQTLYDCCHAFYRPQNMMLCVVGDVDAEQVFHLAEACMPVVSGGLPLRDYGAAEVMRPRKKRVQSGMEVSMPMFAMGFKTEPAEFGEDCMRREIIGDLAAEILAGESSPLYTRLYEKNLIDADFSVGYEGLKGASVLSIGGDSCDPEAVLQAILVEADRIREQGVDKDLFERLRRSALGRRMRDLDSFESICYRMCAYHFEGMDYFTFPDMFRTVTSAQVEQFLNRTVTEARAALSVIAPRTKED